MTSRRKQQQRDSTEEERAKLDDDQMAGRVTSLNVRNVALVALLVCAAFVIYTQCVSDSPLGMLAALGVGVDWKKVNLLRDELPKEVDDFVQKHKDTVRVDERRIDVKGVKLFFREMSPASILDETGKTVLLLHGAAFTSATWQNKLPTMQTLSALGHRVLAVDLPGFGETPAYSGDKGEFLEAVITTLAPDRKVVLVSPSMSGAFALEVLIKKPDLLCGFVPVAPTSTSSYSPEQLSSVHVPTLIVVGENDSGLGKTSTEALQLIPTATKPQVIPNGRHPAYLDDPVRWHTLLYNFVNALRC